MTGLEELGKARLSIKIMRYSKRRWKTKAEKSFSILHPENHTSRCVDTGNTNVAVRVEPQSAVGLLNTHLFNSALAHFFFFF